MSKKKDLNTSFSIDWLHGLEFVIISGSVEFLARTSGLLILQIISYINLYIFFMYLMEMIEKYIKHYLDKCIKKSPFHAGIVRLFIIIISATAAIAMVMLIMQIVDKHSITSLSH